MKDIVRPKNYKSINISQEDNYWNMRACPRFNTCDKNICPLDYYMFKRTALSESDYCPWTKEPKDAKAWGGEIVTFGGKSMPDDILMLVPEHNVYILNQPSKDRLAQLQAGN